MDGSSLFHFFPVSPEEKHNREGRRWNPKEMVPWLLVGWLVPLVVGLDVQSECCYCCYCCCCGGNMVVVSSTLFTLCICVWTKPFIRTPNQASITTLFHSNSRQSQWAPWLGLPFFVHRHDLVLLLCLCKEHHGG